MIQITDADIARVEGLLLPPGAAFNEERREFIRCAESRDVVACPGSGKTTALLAKILILASKMPFPVGSGVCVLTHTNVAIDQIKNLAGTASEVLFRHPNCFGTIQSFVDEFLTIPAYRSEFKKPIVSIDQDLFYSAIEQAYRKATQLHGWLEPRGGADALASYWFHPIDLSIGTDLERDIPRLSKATQTYQYIESIRRRLLNDGVLSYHDAYFLALRYLLRFPRVARALHARFKYVFIDEMQDTDSHQLEVLSLVFDPEEQTLQCLGDPNQAIYRTDVRQEMLWSPRGNPPLHFSDTARYGETIAHLLGTVRVDRQISLLPNAARDSLRPHLLTYENGEERSVLPAFSRLLRELNLLGFQPETFKAVGWVGKDKTEDGKLCLRYYLPEYQRSLHNRKQYFDTLLSYCYVPAAPNVECQGTYSSYNTLLAGIVHAVNLAGQKNPENGHRFTTQTFTRYLRKTNESLCGALLRNLSEWILDYRRGIVCPGTLRDIMAKFIREYWIRNETRMVAKFLDSDEVRFPTEPGKTSNTFVSDDGIRILVGTVHSVKGETHTATLYLETFNYEVDSKRLLPFFEGRYPDADARKSRHMQNLKIAHVALSRPTHLAAFACAKANVAGHEAALEENGWVIRNVNDLLAGGNRLMFTESNIVEQLIFDAAVSGRREAPG